MTSTFTAVYADGKFHPTTRPDLPDGTTVTLTVATTSPLPSAEQSPGELAYETIRAIVSRHAGKPDPIGDGLVVSENVDEVLYSNPHGAGRRSSTAAGGTRCSCRLTRTTPGQ
jgi:hypothetical protein